MNEELFLNVSQTIIALKSYVLLGKCPYMRLEDVEEMVIILEKSLPKIKKGVILSEEDLEEFIESYLT